MVTSADRKAALDEAMALLKRRDMGRAAECFKVLLKDTPDSAAVNFGLGKALCRQKLSAAEPYLRRATELEPAHVEAHVELGHLMRQLRRKNEAIEAFRAALKLDPNHVPAILSICHLLKADGQTAEAEDILRRATINAPENVGVRCRLAELLVLKGATEEAEVVARQALSINPQSSRAAFALGNVLAATRRYAEAAEYYERAAELEPGLTQARTELLAAKRMMHPSAPVRTRPAVWPNKVARFDNLEKVVRDFVLTDYRPSEPIIRKATRVSALGSCFAGHVAQRLRDRGLTVFYKPIGEDINNTYANRYLLDWIVDGPVDEQSGELESIYGAEQRAEFRKSFSETDLFVFTLGVAPAYFHRETGQFVLAHGSSSDSKLLPQICQFRTTTIAENLDNLRHIIKRIRSLSPKTKFVITVSPVPLIGTYEMGSAVVADTLSKATLRLTVDELMRSGEEGIYYWPSFEIVRWLGAHVTARHPPVYGADDGYTRHVSVWLVDMIMKLFIEYFGDQSVQPRDEAAA